MAAKATLVLCALAIMVQHVVNVSGACCGSLGGRGGGCGCGCGCGSGVTSSGGQFVVSSVSQGSPTGILVQSENRYEGELCLSGLLPFIGVVQLQGGCLPTCGSGSVCYDCGGCDIGISERQCGCGCGCGL